MQDTLNRAAAKQAPRRFTGEPLTGFGQLGANLLTSMQKLGGADVLVSYTVEDDEDGPTVCIETACINGEEVCVVEYIPEWVVKTWETAIGDEWMAEVRASNEEAQIERALSSREAADMDYRATAEVTW